MIEPITEVVDRFICRREGHEPMVRVTGGPVRADYVTSCKRCGKFIECHYEPKKAS